MNQDDDEIRAQGRAEARARHDREDDLIRGLADALEAKVRVDEMVNRTSARSPGGPDGPQDLLHDSVELAVRTLREVMRLQTRANRMLTGWLDRTMPDPRPTSHPQSVDRPLELRPEDGRARGELHLENKRGHWLRVRFPSTLTLEGHTWPIEFRPSSIDLAPADQTEVAVALSFDGNPPSETLRGHIPLEVDSNLAPIPVILKAARSAESEQVDE